VKWVGGTVNTRKGKSDAMTQDVLLVVKMLRSYLPFGFQCLPFFQINRNDEPVQKIVPMPVLIRISSTYRVVYVNACRG